MKKQDKDEVTDKEEDEKRETAIRSTQILQPNFKPKGVTQDQLSKFQVISSIYHLSYLSLYHIFAYSILLFLQILLCLLQIMETHLMIIDEFCYVLDGDDASLII